MLKLVLFTTLALSPALLRADIYLTGLYVFSADSSGNDVPPAAGYTGVPNNGTYVLWVAEGGYNAPLLNGPTRNDAAISAPLPVGTYLFSVFNQGQTILPSIIPPYFGLNLFFGGDTLNPGISVFAATNYSASGPFPTISADAGTTIDLSGTQRVPGAGSLTFVSDGDTVTLSDFVYSEPFVYNVDRISNFDTSPGGGGEYVGQFTLDVTENAETPEPSFLLPVGTLFIGLFALRKLWRVRA
jgi:hypothetical protein